MEVVSLVLGNSVTVTTSEPSVRLGIHDPLAELRGPLTVHDCLVGRLFDHPVGHLGPRHGALDHRFEEQETWTSLAPFVGIGLGHRQGRYLAKLWKQASVELVGLSVVFVFCSVVGLV